MLDHSVNLPVVESQVQVLERELGVLFYVPALVEELPEAKLGVAVAGAASFKSDEVATGKAVLAPTGRVLRLRVAGLVVCCLLRCWVGVRLPLLLCWSFQIF